MSIKLNLDGFEEMIKKIEKTGGSVDGAVRKCLENSAVVVENEIKSQMQSSDTTGNISRLIARMPSYEIQNNFGRITARVGFKKGEYDPKNPSDGYKAVFLNYGTPRRSKHGKIQPRGFIDRAKKIARPKVKRIQLKTFENILRDL